MFRMVFRGKSSSVIPVSLRAATYCTHTFIQSCNKLLFLSLINLLITFQIINELYVSYLLDKGQDKVFKYNFLSSPFLS